MSCYLCIAPYECQIIAKCFYCSVRRSIGPWIFDGDLASVGSSNFDHSQHDDMHKVGDGASFVYVVRFAWYLHLFVPELTNLPFQAQIIWNDIFFVQEVFPRKSLSSLVHVVAHFPNTSVNCRTQQLPPFWMSCFRNWYSRACGKVQVQNAYAPFLPCCLEFDIQMVHLGHNVKWVLDVQHFKIDPQCTHSCAQGVRMYNRFAMYTNVHNV